MNRTRLRRLALAVFTLSIALFAGHAHAWTPNGQIARITEVITHQDNNTQVVYRLDNGYACWFYSTGQNSEALTSLVLSAFLGNKDVSVHCYETVNSIGGISARRHHRIVVLN